MKRSGFTLVELSIVLVILGLLVGGVLSGQSLIRAAELRTVITERDKYFTAMHAFRDKYLTIAGDMPNAFTFWPNSGRAGCVDATVSTLQGCNGNNNGQIESREQLKTWLHLSLAGLVDGQYDGYEDSSYFYGTNNSPKAKLGDGIWLFSNSMMDIDSPDFVSVPSGTFLYLFNIQNNALPTLTQSEAWNIDKKSDDGFSKTGSMRSVNTIGSGTGAGLDGACYDQHIGGNASNPRDDAYGISQNANRAQECILVFIYRK